MKYLTKEQYKKVQNLMPKPRGNVLVDNLNFLNALLYMLDSGCSWRTLPSSFGPWATIYKRFRRWSENGVLKKVFDQLQQDCAVDADVSLFTLDASCAEIKPGAFESLKKLVEKER